MRRPAVASLLLCAGVVAAEAADRVSTAENNPQSHHRRGKNVVTVALSGGNYASPIAAVKNAFEGDAWCMAPKWPKKPCIVRIKKGIFFLDETLSIPEGLLVTGVEKRETRLVADRGVTPAVFLFGDARISDLTIVNSQTDAEEAVGLHVSGVTEKRVTRGLVARVAIGVDGALRNTGVIKDAGVRIAAPRSPSRVALAQVSSVTIRES